MGAVRAVTGDIPLRAHFHNTRNTGYANALAAYEAGVAVLDASLGGIGGCPFAPRATGNIATEDLVYALERSGVDTGCDLDALIGASEWLGERLGRPTPSLVSKAGGFPAAQLLTSSAAPPCNFGQRPLRWSLAGPLPVGIELGSHGRHPNERQALHRAGRGRGPSRRRLPRWRPSSPTRMTSPSPTKAPSRWPGARAAGARTPGRSRQRARSEGADHTLLYGPSA